MSFDPFDHDLERGLRNRRAILGDAWVDQSTTRSHTFNAEFQSFITRYAWHEVWGRPGLPAPTRRMLVLASTAALSRWEEFELHCRASLTAGDPDTRLTPEQIKEVLIQTAIYAGVPAANTGVAIAARLLREAGHDLAPMTADQAAHPGTGRSHRTVPQAGRPGIHYTVREPRDVDTPRHTVVLAHALGCDASMWDSLANALASDCRVICIDGRGHGASDAPDGPYTMAELADDAARVIAQAGGGPVVWVGLSMGGMVGQELALAQPGLLRALVIANSAAGYDEAARAGWRQRIATVESQGLEAIADGAMQRWFTAAFRAANPATVARWRRRVVACDARGYLGACHAVMEHDTRARLPGLALPVRVINGGRDEATPPAMGEAIARAVPGATCVTLPDAAHLSVIEQPTQFLELVREFLAV